MLSKNIPTLLLISVLPSLVVAKPYYFLVDPVPAEPANPPATVGAATEEAAQNPAQYAQIQDHLSQLYNHGNSVFKQAVEQMQPDIKNIGTDLTKVYQTTRETVGKKIEPLAHTVKPYIDQAQKAVIPYINSAKEEVPKLMSQAGPALSKVGEQMKGVWGKITNSAQSAAAGISAPAAPPSGAASQVQATGEQVQQSATNTIQEPASPQEAPAST